MAQFDVYLSPGRNRTSAPFVVDVQSRRHELAATRLVIPFLSDLPKRPGGPDLDLLPEF